MATPEPVAGARVVSRDPNYVPPPMLPRESRPVSQLNFHQTDSHTVRKGETLRSIARTYGVSLESLAKENEMDAKQRIAKGKKLWIPSAANDERP